MDDFHKILKDVNGEPKAVPRYLSEITGEEVDEFIDKFKIKTVSTKKLPFSDFTNVIESKEDLEERGYKVTPKGNVFKVDNSALMFFSFINGNYIDKSPYKIKTYSMDLNRKIKDCALSPFCYLYDKGFYSYNRVFIWSLAKASNWRVTYQNYNKKIIIESNTFPEV